MKIVNDTLKNALKRPTTQRKGRILVNGNYYDVYNVEYNADAYNDGNVIGNAIASQLDFELPYIEKFNTFKYFDGVWTGNEYEYIDMGTFTVFDEKDEDDFNKHITAFDNLIKFNAPFVDVGGYPKTLFQELQNVCEQAGVVLNNINIPNGSFRVANNQFVNEESLKTVLKAICQISGMYAIIKNDEIVLQLKNNTNEVLNKNQHEPVIWKRQTYGINQVVLGMKDVEGEYVLREDLQDIAENGVHKLVINDNPFAYTEDKRAELIDELFNQVKGFGYVPFEMNGEWLSYLDVGDTITIDGVETLLLRINGKSPKALESVISAPAVIDSSVDYIDNTNSIENQIKRTEIIVDKQNNKIELLNSQVVPVSNTIKGVRQIQLENAYEGRLHYLSIKGNISLLYPSSKENQYGYALAPNETLMPSATLTPSTPVYKDNKILYPSNDLFSKSSVLLIDDVEYKLDFNFLNYINDTDCDEFIYEDGKCKIIRRVGVDTDGNLYAIGKEVTETKKDIELNIKHNSTIKLKSFDEAILEATYLLQNEYTDNFVTSVDVVSRINLSPGTAQIEASKLATITADKIDLSGKTISLTSDDINITSTNFNLDKNGNLQCNNATMNNAIVTGGTITLKDTTNNPKLNIIYSDNDSINSKLYSNALKFENNDNIIEIANTINTPRATFTNSTSQSFISCYNVTTPELIQTSREESKKNFELFNDALSELLKIDIYKYNLKSEDDTHKKHLGFVIGDKYNYSHLITAEHEGKEIGVDNYSMTSLCLQAIKEQQRQIEKLTKEINELKENDINEENKFCK